MRMAFRIYLMTHRCVERLMAEVLAIKGRFLAPVPWVQRSISGLRIALVFLMDMQMQQPDTGKCLGKPVFGVKKDLAKSTTVDFTGEDDLRRYNNQPAGGVGGQKVGKPHKLLTSASINQISSLKPSSQKKESIKGRSRGRGGGHLYFS
ncbi:hypothetical protein Dimus_020360 [Dionaea muscipula]